MNIVVHVRGMRKFSVSAEALAGYILDIKIPLFSDGAGNESYDIW